MALSAIDQIMLNLPNGVNLTINGVAINVQDVLDLDEVNGSIPLALAWIFRCLESDHKFSETAGQYSYTRWGMRGSEFWEARASSDALSSNAPNVILRPPVARGRGYGGYCP